jgi:hypothetical protein
MDILFDLLFAALALYAVFVSFLIVDLAKTLRRRIKQIESINVVFRSLINEQGDRITFLRNRLEIQESAIYDLNERTQREVVQ